jgi:hypothetical protein
MGHNRRPGPKEKALQAKLQVLGGLGVKMLWLDEGLDPLRVAAAQDPQGFLIPAPGFG